MDSHFHVSRRERFYEGMSDGEALLLFAGEPPRKTADARYRFFANRNFYYMTGITQAQSALLAVKQDGSISEKLFLLKKDALAERWQGYRLSPAQATECSGIEDIGVVDDLGGELAQWINKDQLSAIWYDFDKHDTDRTDTPERRHWAGIRSQYPFLDVKNAYGPICWSRAVKTSAEIDAIRDAMCVTRDGIHAMMRAARPGMREYQLEAVFNAVLANEGIREPAFESIVSSGSNNFYIHYEDPLGTLNDGDLVLTDVGAIKHHYCNDISRPFPVNGTFSPQQREIYAISLMVNKELMALLEPHKTTFPDIEAHARRRVGEALVAAGYLKPDEDVGKYYWHGGTHHLGLDVHDVAPHRNLIEPGMVFTIDVGIYIPDINVGLRIEDNVAITEDGYEHLSHEIVREPDDVESMMHRD